MIVDQLFNKNVNESLADEFMKMAQGMGHNPRLRGTPDEERKRTQDMLAQRAADRAAAPAPAPISDEERAKLQARLKELEAKFDPNFEYSDDHSFWRSQHEISQQINAIKKKLAESKKSKKRRVDEAWLMEDPVYRKFKKVGGYITERKMTEKEILDLFAQAETAMTDKATGANRTWIGRGKDTTMDFAGGVKDAFNSIMNSIQSSAPVSAVDVAYDKATDAVANLAGGQNSPVMQAIKGYRNLVKEYPKAAGFAKAALVAIAGLATGGASLPVIAGLTYAIDSAIRGDKLSSVLGKGAGAAAVTWGGQKLASMFAGDAAAADTGAAADAAPDTGAAGSADAGAAAAPSRFDDIVNNAVDYKIKQGDTLSDILADRKINPEAFRRLPGNEVYFSPDGNPNIINAGDTIKLPRPEDIPDLNRMSYTTPDPANYARFDKEYDTTGYTGQYNPNNSRFSLDAATNLKQQQLGNLGPDSGIAANRVAQDAARAAGGPELLGGPEAGDVAAGAMSAPQPSLSFTGGNTGTLTLADGSQVPVQAYPPTGLQPRLPPGGEAVTVNYGGQDVNAYIYNGKAYIKNFSPEQVSNPVQESTSSRDQKIAQLSWVIRESIAQKVKFKTVPVDQLFDYDLIDLATGINESIGKGPARAVYLTNAGVDAVFENINRFARVIVKEAAVLREPPEYSIIDEYPPEPLYPAPRPKPTPAPTPTPTPAPAPKPAPAVTPPTGQVGPGRDNLPNEYRPDMPGGSGGYDKSKKSVIGRGLDWLNRAAGKAGSALSTFGHQFTTNVTKEKLKMNWHQAGKPSDSDQLAAWLVSQGVPQDVVTTVYNKMGIPYVAPVDATQPAEKPVDATKPAEKPADVSGNKQVPLSMINPNTGQRYTYAELNPPEQPVKAPVTQPEQPVKTPVATTTVPQGPASFNAANVMKLPGMEKYAKQQPAPAKTPNFAGPSGYKSVTTSFKPTVAKTPTTPVPAPTAVKPKVVSGGPTPDEQAKLAQRIAQAAKQPVAEMLEMVETKEDVQRIKQFIDQMFVKYGAVNESAFAVRNRLIEHVTQVGAQRRREFARRS